MQNDNDNQSTAAATQALRDDVRRFKAKAAQEQRGALRLLISDFEYRYDMDSFRRYQHDDEDRTKGWVRWPFCHFIGASWTCLTFYPDAATPEVSPIITLTGDAYCERAIVEQFFAAIDAQPGAILTSWGGEQKDWPVARRVAAECGIPMPAQLADLRVHSPSRLDLCNTTSCQARFVHLPEYCIATGIPAKAFPSRSVGYAAADRDWETIGEQVRSDVFATAIIATRHAISHRMTSADLVSSEQAIAAAFAAAYPNSHFSRHAGQRLANARAMPISAKVA